MCSSRQKWAVWSKGSACFKKETWRSHRSEPLPISWRHVSLKWLTDSLGFWVLLNTDIVKWSHILLARRFHPFVSHMDLTSWGGPSSLLTEGLLCSRYLGMLIRNKKMLHDFSRSVSASPVNVALWESVTWVLHVPAGLLARDGQCLLRSPVLRHEEESGLGIWRGLTDWPLRMSEIKREASSYQRLEVDP